MVYSGGGIVKKNILMAILVVLTVLMTGCGKYFEFDTNDMIPDENYSKYEDDISDIYSWRDDGEIVSQYNFRMGIQDGTSAILEGRGVAIWGTSTLADFKLVNETDIELIRNEKDKSGYCKLVICDEDGIIESLEENEKKALTLKPGEYKIKIIGKPAEFSKLTIGLKGIDYAEFVTNEENNEFEY